MTDDLIAFWRARLNEAEAIARRNIGAEPGTANGLGDTADGGPSWPDYQTYDSDDLTAATDYISHFRPLAMLADVAADRALLAEYERYDDDPAYLKGLEFAIACRAARFSSHPDYEPEWAPDTEA